MCTQCEYPMEDSSFRVCWTCWKTNQDYTRTKGDDRYDGLQSTLRKLQQHTDAVQKKSGAYRKKALQFKAERDALRAQRHNVDPETLRKLIKFCHPDKNMDRSEEATALTKLLLTLRPKNPRV